MSLIELFIIAVGLSMDAFAISICKGLSLRSTTTLKRAGLVGLYFGVSQAVMPVVGYFLGSQFHHKITAFDHWIAFVVLGLIGFNMVRESRNGECEQDDSSEVCCDVDESLNFKNMCPLAIATSIDALAVGITFSLLKVDIIPAASFIGIVTFTISALGVKVGSVFGSKYKSKAELIGGLMLMFMGLKILLEHTVLV